VAGDFTFVPDVLTSSVVDFPRATTFTTGDGRLHAAWPALVNGHAGVMAAMLAANAGAVELRTPIALSGEGALEDAVGGQDGSYAAVWWGADGPGLSKVDGRGAVHVTAALATERPLRFAKVAIDRDSGRLLVVWSQGTPLAGYRPVAWTG